MAITLRTTKILWGRSGNRCAICRNELVEDAIDAADDESVVGDMAHIIARKETFTRGDYDALSGEGRDHYSNLILLCRKHHKVIDDQPAHYTVERLREIKRSHEEWVQATLGQGDQAKLRDDQSYAAITDDWCKRIEIDTWTSRGTFICSANGPRIRKEDHTALTDLPPWIISRVWPHRYELLEASFFNFMAVAEDFVNVLNRHLDDPSPDSEWLVTKKFYQIEEWNPAQYEELYRQYDDHVCLTNNLFFELTRAASLICHRVRQHVFHGFRVKEGVILVQRDMVRGFSSESHRAEYRAEQINEKSPYKGLAHFVQHQYETGYFLVPEHLQETVANKMKRPQDRE